MSYRTIKRVLGETSLERKCRFLFGGGLMVLITGAFYFYGQLNLRIVEDRNRVQARLLIEQRFLVSHLSKMQSRQPGDDQVDTQYRQLIDGLQIGRDGGVPTLLPETLLTGGAAGTTDPAAAEGDAARTDRYSFAILSPDPQEKDAARRPSTQDGYEAIAAISRGEQPEVALVDREAGVFRYFGAIPATASCVECHQREVPGQANLQVGDLLGVGRINFSLSETERAVARNNAVLLAMAVVTTFLAMLAAYAIVRYVIVKPVLHLKEVSDQIAHGELHQRADIHTGDEFEELSLAFNRMLRYLVSMQDDLRSANAELDANVDQLAAANLELFETNKVKNEFLATMSHELRTPLNSILGFSEVLSGAENLSDRQRRYVRNIDTSGRGLLALIDDILDLAKIEAGKMRRTVTTFELVDVVEHQVSAMQPLAEKRTIELVADVESDLPTMRQDIGKLQQILANLLSNALKFTPEGGRVRVIARLQRADDRPPLESETATRRLGGATPPPQPAVPMVRLEVVDTGIGIRLDDQAVIFEKFRQARGSSEHRDAMTREYEGTGLGLSIVRELARLLGGEVGVQSEFGKGSTFWVRLPCEIEADDDSLDDGASLKAATLDFGDRIRAAQEAKAG